MAHRRVVVTGIGIISPLGLTAEASWRALLAGQSGVAAARWGDDIPSQVVATVPASFDADAALGEKGAARNLARFAQLGLVAADEAMRHARWDPASERVDRDRAGVAIASGIGAMEEIIGAQATLDQRCVLASRARARVVAARVAGASPSRVRPLVRVSSARARRHPRTRRRAAATARPSSVF